MSKYTDFLATKRIMAHAVGFTIAPEDIHPSLFDFQRTLTLWSARKGRSALFTGTGTGKSRMQLEWARLTGERTLIVAPLSVARQTVKEGAIIGVDVHYTRSGDDLIDGVNITNYDMVEHFDARKFGAVVLDECFPPGTLIDTPDGPRPIATICEGDTIFNAWGKDTVADIHRREVQYAIKITVGGRCIISSPNHPYFTQRGWVGAQDLRPFDGIMETTEAMRMVRDGIYQELSATTTEEQVLRAILCSEMAYEPTEDYCQGAFAGSSSETWEKAEGVVGVRQPKGIGRTGTDTITQSAVNQRGDEGKTLPHIESDGPRTFRAWGQRSWFDSASTDYEGCTRTDLGNGVCFVVGETDSRLSNTLQTRLGKSRSENRYRSGWKLTPQQEIARRKEGCEVGFSRVESIEVLESGHPELECYRDANGHIYFYDIGATWHPSFSVNGLLVHNSSILAGLNSKTRARLTTMFEQTPLRLCCTATPAPNDIAEIANHAEFLGIMSRADMLATFFIHDDEGWRLKGHAHQEFYRWLASWGIFVRKPSDIGFPDDGYDLPPLSIEPVWTDTNYQPEGMLFSLGLKGVSDRARVRRGSLTARVEAAAERINGSPHQWIIWRGLIDEGVMLGKTIRNSVVMKGSDSPDRKQDIIEGFQDGKYQHLITDTKMSGFGLNLQNAWHQAFVGINDSWQSLYQAVRRSWRFGQVNPVDVLIFLSREEEPIYHNVMRKDAEATKMAEEMLAHVREFERAEIAGTVHSVPYTPAVKLAIPGWMS